MDPERAELGYDYCLDPPCYAAGFSPSPPECSFGPRGRSLLPAFAEFDDALAGDPRGTEARAGMAVPKHAYVRNGIWVEAPWVAAEHDTGFCPPDSMRPYWEPRRPAADG
jgi:hypothetical protein